VTQAGKPIAEVGRDLDLGDGTPGPLCVELQHDKTLDREVRVPSIAAWGDPGRR
jgi:hypothetical protein